MKITNKVKVKKIPWVGLGVASIVAVIVYFAITSLLFPSTDFDPVLKQAAEELNTTTPMLVDEYTQLDNAVALPNNTFQYNYSLPKNSYKEVSATDVINMEEEFINTIRTNPAMKVFRDNDVTINYSYKDKDGVFIAKIVITPDEYK